MNKKTILIIGGIIIIIGIIGGVLFFLQKSAEPDIPYYFIAIHNEPWHEPSHTEGGEERIAKEYLVLEEIVDKADQYNIKLTLMFTAQWSDYIVTHNKLEKISEWEKNGHEIAQHHHSVNHGNWDGYTDYPEDVAIEKRKKTKPLKYESYLGTLDDFMNKVKRLNPDLNSGCSNAKNDNLSMPDEIIYDTCSGYANFGETQKLSDINPGKGRNDYILSFDVNGIKRYWLAHYQIYKDVELAKNAYDNLTSSQAYGVVIHSFEDEAEKLYEFMQFLYEKDPSANRSKTVSEIIEDRLLPEKTILKKLIDEKTQIPYSSKKQGMCGDFICDEFEEKNNVCPEDCN
ncbi:MAG: hypothetical protein KJ646_04230 [Nanoarchaeota archaeon]|nr:hypothetical protein [Nanoarchaeota archaeon]